MAKLHIDPDYIERLIVKVRAVMAEDDIHELDDTSDLEEDEKTQTFLENSDDLCREELVEEIQGLDARQQAELVALLWLGRDDGEAEEWQDLIQLARERYEIATEKYLLDHPHLADHWENAIELLNTQN